MRGRIVLLALPLLGGCAASLPQDDGFDEVAATVEQRLEQKAYWYRDREADAEIRDTVARLLERPLSADASIQVALLNNRHLQETYARLGLARADLVQAGLLGNPTLFSSIRFPSRGSGTNLEFEVAQGFLDILLRPARQRMAQSEFERTQLAVSQEVLDFSAEVLIAYREVQAAARRMAVFEVLNESSQAGYELAQRFEEAGNMTPLALSRHRAIAAEAETELQRVQDEYHNRRDALSRLLGLAAGQRDWRLADPLPALPEQALETSQLAQRASDRRLDLQALRKDRERLQQALAMTTDTRYLGGAEFGFNAERETDGSSLYGPNFAIELPIFDQKQAQIARLETLLLDNSAAIQALERDIENDVLAGVDRLQRLRDRIMHYRDEVIPANEDTLKHMQREQNYMLADVFDLLLVQRQARSAYRGYIDSLRDYWIARAELQRATAATLAGQARTTHEGEEQ